jgi:glycosyltransferase involved in cell wall biosynthesis
MLGQWAMAHGRWKKRLAWSLYQHRDLQSATAFHVTSELEADEVRSLGFRQPIAVIPNGFDFPIQLPTKQKSEERHAIFLSRLHPKKGLTTLVRAWSAASMPSNWRLTIAGPDEVIFSGALDDSAKWQAYVNADLFVLPSYNENFGIVIAEAMAAGLPVVTTTGTPWSVLNERGYGWWVEPNVEMFAKSLREAASTSPDVLHDMGQRARDYVQKTFSWSETANKMITFYDQLFNLNFRNRIN